jgi:large subunit ribosomal protein L30
MAAQIKITLVKSGIGRNQYFTKVLKGLRLTKLHKTVELPDTPEIRGMINKVSHMVVVEG